MNRNLLNFTGVLIAMAFINFASGATNLNKQVFATQLGSYVPGPGNVQNSADRGEQRSPPAVQPVVAETSPSLTTRGTIQPRPPGSVPNISPVAETPKPTYLLTTSQNPAPGINNPPTIPVTAESETSTDATVL